MGLLDVILGRSKPVKPDLDQLFGLTSAAITLEAASELRPTGLGSVCFAAVEGGAFAEIQQDLRALVGAEASQDAYGYTWLLARKDPAEMTDLVTDLHAINSALEERGFGPQLLCSLLGFKDPAGRSVALVYLYKRGSFYPVCIRSDQQKRDTARELEIAALVKDDLRIEPDKAR
ncbi:PspA-associated protein PspAB, partial [Streptomyces sp. CBMA29]|uniref:PspA-associated protein PspAB n=1 Tax=Streptomyces sp. CBMA29 TaxID=1896314 RepID=UPI0016620E76